MRCDVMCCDMAQVCLNSGDFASAEKLIQAGCDVNARDAFGRYVRMTSTLCTYTCREREGLILAVCRTALHICCDRGLNELAFLLLDNGADPHARTKVVNCCY